jgi:hypothetical protein
MGRVTITLADLPDNTVDVGVDFINNDGQDGTDNDSLAHRLGAYLLHCASSVDGEDERDE